uniref:Uncharacterized protein n=1 Tax=Micrurus corallinus TaxID=54390 RepID=A0A2D4EW72_MICCO
MSFSPKDAPSPQEPDLQFWMNTSAPFHSLFLNILLTLDHKLLNQIRTKNNSCSYVDVKETGDFTAFKPHSKIAGKTGASGSILLSPDTHSQIFFLFICVSICGIVAENLHKQNGEHARGGPAAGAYCSSSS